MTGNLLLVDPKEVGAQLFREAAEVVEEIVADVKLFVASEQGRKLRQYAATGLIAAAPAVASMPFLRRTRLGKFVELAGGAALIVTVAERIRDWEPEA